MLRDQFEQFLVEQQFVVRRQHVIVGVSGGVDSMVLLDLFAGCATRFGFQLSVVHANHQLRGAESDGDELFVIEHCRRLGISCVTTRLDVIGTAERDRTSIPSAARELRYAFFEESRNALQADAVATAHHADDNAETVLLNILRGTGLRGLAGIPIHRANGNIVRPLLWARRSEIEAFAASEQIPFRTDRSNLSPKYARNELRLRIIPELVRRTGTDVGAKLSAAASMMRDVIDALDRLVEAAKRDVVVSSADACDDRSITISLKEFSDQHPLVQEHLLLDILRAREIEPSEERISAILGLTNRQTGKRVELPDNWLAFRERDSIVLAKRRTEEPGIIALASPGSFEYLGHLLKIEAFDEVPSDLDRGANSAVIDADKVTSDLVLRRWSDGDWFVPLGLSHHKKLSDFFVDQKTPSHLKHSIPIVASGKEIVWICGMRLDDRFKVTPLTQRTMTFTFR